jgi:DNA-binding GntR family transcriptional regulator
MAKSSGKSGLGRAAAAVAAVPSRAHLIALRVEEDIVLGRRHPRERLVEQDLSEQFDTHRGDVRLALFELEKKGLIERIRNRGAVVRDLTPKEVRDIYDVREDLEVMAVRIMPFPVPAADIARLEALQREHGRAVDHGDVLAVYNANIRFHRALLGLCGNDCLTETIESLAQKVSSIRSYAHANPGSLENSRRDHVAMIEALKRSRRSDLVALTRRHLKPAPLAYIEAYEKRFGRALPPERQRGRISGV